jgi:hypothetical protein
MIKIIDLPLFSPEDLRCRWLLARVASLEKALGLDRRAGGMSIDLLIPYELELLVQIKTEEVTETVLRNVFDHSRQLGMSLVRYLKHTFELSDLAEIIPSLGSPCFAGNWRIHNQAYVLTRLGCSSNGARKSWHCDYWREALDGFVMGVGNDERLARHRSQGHGDSDCQDILFMETESKKVVGDGISRWGALPEELANHLRTQSITFEQKGYYLMVHGYSEGKLFYEMKAKATGNCGPGERMMSTHFESKVVQDFPNLKFAEISPQSVLDHKEA